MRMLISSILFLNICRVSVGAIVHFAVPHRNMDILEHYATHISVGDAWPLDTETILDISVDKKDTNAVLTHAYWTGARHCDTSKRDWVTCTYTDNKCPTKGPADMVLLHGRHTHPGTSAFRIPDDDAYVVPSTLAKQYQFPSTFSGGSVRIGAVEFLADQSIWWSDVESFARQTNHSLPAGWPPHIVGPWDNSTADIEASLDVDTIVGNAPWLADVWHWTTEHWMLTWAMETFHRQEIPDVVSLSWGWSENQQCSVDAQACSFNTTSETYVKRANEEFLKLSVRGLTIVASAGDAGAPGRTNEDCVSDTTLNPAFPAASPYVVAVGATFYKDLPPTTSQGAPICHESGCYDGGYPEHNCGFGAGCGFTGGSGFSNVAPAPKWQQSHIDAYLNDPNAYKPPMFNKKGRGYPDVTAMGLNYYVIADGDPMSVGGTSASAPLVASALAYVISARGRALGMAGPFLYAMADTCDDCFGTVKGVAWSNCTEQQCCDQGYSSGSEGLWNPVTGLGTPNVTAWIAFARQ